ncbi:MAG: ankyrin repeat domain-containing protein [Alphaproteobacteria bacterium]
MTELAQTFTIHGQTPEALATALMDEMQEGKVQGKQADYEFMKKLITAGAKLDHVHRWGRNPLQLAAGMQYHAIVDALIAAKSPLDAQDPEGFTALHMAAMVFSARTTRKLLDAGADPFLKDNTGKTARDYALSTNDQKIIVLYDTAIKNRTEAAQRAAEAAAAIKAADDQYLAAGMPLPRAIRISWPLTLKGKSL